MKQRSESARRARTIAGAALGVLLAAGGAGLVAGASNVPLPASLAAGSPRAVDVPAGDTVRTCPGPARLLQGTPVDGDPQFSPASTTATTSLSALVVPDATGAVPEAQIGRVEGPSIQQLPGNPTSAAVQDRRASVAASVTVDSPASLSATARGGLAPSSAALLRFSAGDGDLRGLAAAACATASNDLWLVGAGTAVGRTSILTLSNPSRTPATVDLEFFGDNPLDQAPPGSRGLTVKPGSSASYVLSGFLPDQANVSVHVRSSGGPVAAVIQQSTLRGIVPGGVEFLTAAAAPAPRQTVTGIDLQDPAGAATLATRGGFADAAPALAITVPGAADAVVQLTAYGRNGAVPLAGGGVVTARAGAVTEVPLTGLPAGTYTITAAADVSITAGARVTRGVTETGPLDFASLAASPRLGDNHVLPVGPGKGRALVFGVPDGRAQIRAVPLTEDGRQHAAVTLDVAGHTTAVLAVPESLESSAVAGYVVSASGDPAYGSLFLTGEGTAVAAASFVPAALGAQALPVTLGH